MLDSLLQEAGAICLVSASLFQIKSGILPHQKEFQLLFFKRKGSNPALRGRGSFLFGWPFSGWPGGVFYSDSDIVII